MTLTPDEKKIAEAVFETFTQFSKAVYEAHEHGFSVDVELSHKSGYSSIDCAASMKIEVQKTMRLVSDKKTKCREERDKGDFGDG